MNTHNLPIPVRTGCSKFTLLKKEVKNVKLQFFKQNSNLKYQSDLNKSKTRQGSKNQTKSLQKDKSLGVKVHNEKIKTSLNKTKREIDELAPSLNNKLIKLFKTLDLAKKKNISSTNRTTYEKSFEKRNIVMQNNTIKASNSINKTLSVNNGSTRSTKKVNTYKNNNNKKKQLMVCSISTVQETKFFENLKKEKSKTSAIAKNSNRKKFNEDNLKKRMNERSKDKAFKTYNPFHIGYTKPAKPNQSLFNPGNKNKSSSNNKYLYLSTNQSNIQNNHNTNRTIEQLYSLRPINKPNDKELINTTGDYYEANNEDNNYESDSNGFIHDENDSDDNKEESGVLAYDDVKDIIVYNDFGELSKSNSILFEKKEYDAFIQVNKDRLTEKFFNEKDKKKEHKSPSTNESSQNKRNHMNIIKYSA